jgi:hypothetical protein
VSERLPHRRRGVVLRAAFIESGVNFLGTNLFTAPGMDGVTAMQADGYFTLVLCMCIERKDVKNPLIHG